MVGTYLIYRGGEPVGQAVVTRQGLYYCFSCTCQITGEVMYRIVAEVGDRQENLGIVAPKGKLFGLYAKIPVSHFPQAEPVFRLVPRHPAQLEGFVPFSPEAPFAYLHRLETAFLLRKGEHVAIGFREVTEDPAPQDSDRNP